MTSGVSNIKDPMVTRVSRRPENKKCGSERNRKGEVKDGERGRIRRWKRIERNDGEREKASGKGE